MMDRKDTQGRRAQRDKEEPDKPDTLTSMHSNVSRHPRKYHL